MHDFFGDFRWWSRLDCFSHPQCHEFVSDLEATKRELRVLFPAEVCRSLVEAGAGHFVFGLFLGGGWMDEVDRVLQLGHDLSECPGWNTDSRLVASLRDPNAHEAARFEVGVWAGLRRVGLEPTHEMATNRATPRADFTFTNAGYNFALELKSLSDPQRRLNIGLLESTLSHLALPHMSEQCAQFDLLPDDDFDNQLSGGIEEFRRLMHVVLPSLRSVLSQPLAPGQHRIDGVGTLLVAPRDRAWSASTVGSTAIRVDDKWSIERAANRALRRIAGAEKQLAATAADLRIAVVWGSLDSMPCDVVLAEIADRIKSGIFTTELNYIAILNSHRRAPVARWTTEVAVLPTQPDGPNLEELSWPQALVSWHQLYPGRPGQELSPGR